jgi:DNA polymerase III epsilon subunit family exonuclease
MGRIILWLWIALTFSILLYPPMDIFNSQGYSIMFWYVLFFGILIVFKYNGSHGKKIKTALKKYNIHTFVAIDTETTGLEYNKNEIVEIAAIRFINGSISDRFISLIKPKQPMPPSATLINGITDKTLKNAKSIEDVMPLFLEFIGNDIIVAHNMEFDFAFLSKNADIKNEKLCTLDMARRIVKGVQNYKLATLTAYFGIKDTPNHTATGDAIACGELLKELILITAETTGR